jgi:hypothetical protein
MDIERRQHRRLAIRLPLECRCTHADPPTRGRTTDISTGGVYLELELPAGGLPPGTGSLVRLDLSVPPGAGYSPYQGRIRCTGEVLRVAGGTVGTEGAEGARCGLAVRFSEPLELVF